MQQQKLTNPLENNNNNVCNTNSTITNIEVEPDKLEAALSIYNNCPSTLNKILLSTKNPIIVDTSHQPGILVLSSSSSGSSASSSGITSAELMLLFSPMSNEGSTSSPVIYYLISFFSFQKDQIYIYFKAN